MKITANDVAKYIICEFHEAEDLITNMKVQKLLYYVQGWHLGLHDTQVFPDEFQAWVHGPVQYEVYKEYKNYRWNPINHEIEKPSLELSLVNHIKEVLQTYGGETAYMLELMTHQELPWIEARGGLPADADCQTIISKKTMKSFFTGLANSDAK